MGELNSQDDDVAATIRSCVRIVLVNSQHSGNIGAPARAMKTMGLNQMVLVAPEDHPTPEGVWRAGHALDIMRGASIVSTLPEAVAGCALVVGTSARDRRMSLATLAPRGAARDLVHVALGTDHGAPRPVALVFGRETSGLTNEELDWCHTQVQIPSVKEYESLNLGMAVQVLAYEIRMAVLELMPDSTDRRAGAPSWIARSPTVATEATPRLPGQPEAVSLIEAPSAEHDPHVEWFEEGEVLPTIDDLMHMLDHLEATLGDADYPDPERAMLRLRRLFKRLPLSRPEIQLLRGMFGKIQKRMGAVPTGARSPR